MRRRDLDDLSGVLLLDKDLGLSSNTALQDARHLLGARKAGHTGTLDPLASGLLPLAFGEATKFSSDLLEADKTYEATLALGLVTTTGDGEGEILSDREAGCSREDLERTLGTFLGEIDQVPPMHSALKREGRALYEYAREGIEVERAPRRVTIRSLRILSWDARTPRVEVECGKGTYVRTLAQDIGTRLGCGASLAALRRTRVGATGIGEAVTLGQLRGMTIEARRARLLAVDALIAQLPRVELDEGQGLRFGHGQPVPHPAAAGRVRVYGTHGTLLGTGRCDGSHLAPQRLIATEHAKGGPASKETR